MLLSGTCWQRTRQATSLYLVHSGINRIRGRGAVLVVLPIILSTDDEQIILDSYRVDHPCASDTDANVARPRDSVRVPRRQYVSKHSLGRSHRDSTMAQMRIEFCPCTMRCVMQE